MVTIAGILLLLYFFLKAFDPDPKKHPIAAFILNALSVLYIIAMVVLGIIVLVGAVVILLRYLFSFFG